MDTIIVKNTMDDGDDSLRDAILKANDGDTIIFDLENEDTITLNQELAITKSITINGDINGDGNPNIIITIAENKQSRIFNINDNSRLISVTLNGLIIKGGNSINNSTDQRGGGILNNEDLTISNSFVLNNRANQGGGIFNAGGTLTIEKGSKIHNNISDNNGGGISNLATVTIAHSSIYDNSANNVGGGIANSGVFTIKQGSTISGNTANNKGGGISTDAEVTIIDSSISNNTANNKGGGITIDSSNGVVTIANSTISGNTADNGNGGGIFNTNGTLTITNESFIKDNHAKFSGGISNDNGTLTIDDSFILNNFASDTGGGIGAGGENSTVTITNTQIKYNTATQTAGGIINGQSELIIAQSTISHNSASTGGGIYANQGGDVDIQDSIISYNTATNGGGIFRDIGTITIDNSSIHNNSATSLGGGISNFEADATLTVNNSSIFDNTANIGGGINNSKGNVTINNSSIFGNKANLNGGGIRNGTDSPTLTITNSTIALNTAINNGGGINNADSGVLNVRNSTISGNTANNNGSGINNFGLNVILFSSIIAQNTGDKDIINTGTNSTFSSQGFNLIGNKGDVTITPSQDTDIIGDSDNVINARLGQLRNNGGSTLTMALLAGSPAINAGSNGDNLEFDQRGEGFPRVLQGQADIGAFERRPPTGGGVTPPPMLPTPVVPVPEPLTFNAQKAQIPYIAYFGRPADPDGLAFWSDLLESFGISYSPRGGDSLADFAPDLLDSYLSIISDFANSEEADRLFDGVTNPMRINQIYRFSFNRDADGGGLNYWLGAIERGDISFISTALEIALGARGDDIRVLRNKISSANLFTNALSSSGGVSSYEGENGEGIGRDFLSTVADMVASGSQLNTALSRLGL